MSRVRDTITFEKGQKVPGYNHGKIWYPLTGAEHDVNKLLPNYNNAIVQKVLYHYHTGTWHLLILTSDGRTHKIVFDKTLFNGYESKPSKYDAFLRLQEFEGANPVHQKFANNYISYNAATGKSTIKVRKPGEKGYVAIKILKRKRVIPQQTVKRPKHGGAFEQYKNKRVMARMPNNPYKKRRTMPSNPYKKGKSMRSMPVNRYPRRKTNRKVAKNTKNVRYNKTRINTNTKLLKTLTERHVFIKKQGPADGTGNKINMIIAQIGTLKDSIPISASSIVPNRDIQEFNMKGIYYNFLIRNTLDDTGSGDTLLIAPTVFWRLSFFVNLKVLRDMKRQLTDNYGIEPQKLLVSGTEGNADAVYNHNGNPWRKDNATGIFTTTAGSLVQDKYLNKELEMEKDYYHNPDSFKKINYDDASHINSNYHRIRFRRNKSNIRIIHTRSGQLTPVKSGEYPTATNKQYISGKVRFTKTLKYFDEMHIPYNDRTGVMLEVLPMYDDLAKNSGKITALDETVRYVYEHREISEIKNSDRF